MASASWLLLHILLWAKGHMQEINVTFKGLVYTRDTGMEEETVLKVALCVTIIRVLFTACYSTAHVVSFDRTN